MEKPTYTAIDYSYQKNKIIEDRIREYYPKVKALIEMVITKRLRNPNTPNGLCADFMEEDEKLWQEVIKPWLRVPLSKLNPYYLQNAFWFPTVKEYNPLRLDILEYALDDLERIHNKRVNLLFEFDKPIIG